MRSCLSFLVVEFMRQGLSPQKACELGVQRMLKLPPANITPDKMYPQLTVAVIAMNSF